VIDKLNKEINAGLADAKIRARLVCFASSNGHSNSAPELRHADRSTISKRRS